ncbi:MAG: hypothetical protein AAB214_00810 [Fibrobacterota bacterium]
MGCLHLPGERSARPSGSNEDDVSKNPLSSYSTDEIETEIWRRHFKTMRDYRMEVAELRKIIEEVVYVVKLSPLKVNEAQMRADMARFRALCSVEDFQALVDSLKKDEAKLYAYAFYVWEFNQRTGKEPENTCDERTAETIRDRILCKSDATGLFTGKPGRRPSGA